MSIQTVSKTEIEPLDIVFHTSAMQFLVAVEKCYLKRLTKLDQVAQNSVKLQHSTGTSNKAAQIGF